MWVDQNAERLAVRDSDEYPLPRRCDWNPRAPCWRRQHFAASERFCLAAKRQQPLLLIKAFHNSIDIENRHIRSLVRSVLLPILKTCNSRYLERILVNPLYRRVFTDVGELTSESHPPSSSQPFPASSQYGKSRSLTSRGSVDGCWQGYEAIVHEKPAEQFMDDDVVMRVFGQEMIYVVRENSLRHLHRDICDLALTICNMAMQCAMLETGGGVESSSSSVPAAEVVLQMHGAMAALLNILSNSLVCKRGQSGRAAQLITRE